MDEDNCRLIDIAGNLSEDEVINRLINNEVKANLTIRELLKFLNPRKIAQAEK